MRTLGRVNWLSAEGRRCLTRVCGSAFYVVSFQRDGRRGERQPMKCQRLERCTYEGHSVGVTYDFEDEIFCFDQTKKYMSAGMRIEYFT